MRIQSSPCLGELVAGGKVVVFLLALALLPFLPLLPLLPAVALGLALLGLALLGLALVF